MNIFNSVFVDCTASDSISELYEVNVEEHIGSYRQ